MKAKLYHVYQDDLIVLLCPSCQKASRASVSKFRNKKHKLITKCKCGFRFHIQLNFRKHYRKSVNIVGQVMIQKTGHTSIRKIITISDLSKTGLRFKMVSNVKLQTGDIVLVKFDLETKQSTTIEKEVVIRFASKDQYGCEFTELDLKEKELGFFLLGG